MRLDRYIEDYLLYNFRNMLDDSVSRDYDTESRLMLASKCEYFLQRLFQQNRLEAELGISHSRMKGNLKYEITPNNIVYYNSSGKADLLYRPISVFNAFKITCKPAHVRLSLFQLYGKLHNLDYTNVAEALYEQYKNEIDVMISGNNRFLLSLSRLSKYETCHNWDNYQIAVLVKYLNDKKIILPVFYEKLCQNDASHFCFWPTSSNGAVPLYSSAAMNNKDAAIILTEEFELATINQQILNNSRVSDVEWHCYWPQPDAQLIPNQVSGIDWSQLENRNVYYLLKGGSGTTRDISLKRARIIESKLAGIAKNFKYISLFTNISETPTPDTGIGIPVVLNPKELAATLKNKYQQQRVPLTSETFAQHQISFDKKGKMLLAPVIHEKSISVLYGNEYSYRSWFALCVAFFMSQGQKVVGGWTTGRLMTPALYLYGDNLVDTNFDDKLDMVKAIYNGRAKAAAERYKRKEHIPGINANKVHAINNNFHGKVIEYKAQNPHEEISAFPSRNAIDEQISSFEKCFPNENRLLVLDNIFSAKNEYALANIRALLPRLKKRDWAVIIVDANEEESVARPKKNNMPIYKNKLSVNNLIRINHLINEDITKSQMSIKLETTYKLKPDIDVQFKCELDAASETPTFRRLKKTSPVWGKAYKKQRDKLNEKVEKLHKNDSKGKDIAEKLGISLSLVKKIKTELGISKKRPQKTHL